MRREIVPQTGRMGRDSSERCRCNCTTSRIKCAIWFYCWRRPEPAQIWRRYLARRAESRAIVDERQQPGALARDCREHCGEVRTARCRRGRRIL